MVHAKLLYAGSPPGATRQSGSCLGTVVCLSQIRSVKCFDTYGVAVKCEEFDLVCCTTSVNMDYHSHIARGQTKVRYGFFEHYLCVLLKHVFLLAWGGGFIAMGGLGTVRLPAPWRSQMLAALRPRLRPNLRSPPGPFWRPGRHASTGT